MLCYPRSVRVSFLLYFLLHFLLLPFFFFFNDTATTEIYTLSLHDALPISSLYLPRSSRQYCWRYSALNCLPPPDRKSTRLNSSHSSISYAVFCLKKKKKKKTITRSKFSRNNAAFRLLCCFG